MSRSNQQARKSWLEFWERRNQKICQAANAEFEVKCCRPEGHERKGVKHAFISPNERIYW